MGLPNHSTPKSQTPQKDKKKKKKKNQIFQHLQTSVLDSQVD